jgi:hypothetical protein
MKRAMSLLVGVLVFLGGVATARAQTYQGGIRGAVKEGANVVPGVNVELTNEATNVSRATVTNSVGEYAFSSVAPGTYTLKASLQGFKTVLSKGIRIGTQQFITMDVALEVGSLQEAIEVVGQAPLLENSNASVGETLDKRQLETIPTAGRNPFFLAITTPNVVPSGDPQFVRQQDQTNSSLLNLAGGPTRANNYTLDGVSITDIRNRATIIPTIEATEEVKVQVSTYDAQMGRTGGGVFNTTGKSGSNQWHGSALGQNRPQWGRSKDFFSRDQPKPDTYFYLYGGSVGGPIVKDKTFFWAAAEGYKTKTAGSKELFLPTEAERNGDFSRSGFIVYDPLTTRPDPRNPGHFIRDPFPGNVIPASRINAVSKKMASYLPLPSSGHSLPSTASLIDRAIQATFKLDHKFSSKDQASVMYLYYDSTEPEARFFSKNLGDNPADPGEGALYRTVHVVAVNNTYQASPDTVVTLRYGYTSFLDNCVPNQFDPGTLGFSQAFLGQITSPKFPYVVVPGYDTSTCCDAMVGDRSRQDTTYYSHNANFGITRLFGRHSVKAGLDYRKIGLKNTSFGDHSGAFFYDAGFTQGPDPLVGGAGDPFASFLLGFPSSGDFTVGTPNNFFINYYAGYLHDDFHASSKLTVNYGLRYEFEQGLQETQNHFTVGFSRDAPFPVQVPGLNLKGGLMYAGVNGAPTHQSDPSHTKFGPRVGFAWSPEVRTVVRGGYGLFWSPNQYAFPNENRYGARGYTAITDMVTSIDGGLTPCSVLPASRSCPTFSMTNPFPSGVEQPVGSSLGLLTGAGGTVNFVDQFRKSAYVHQYSLDIQRELGADMMVSVGYLGARSEHLSLGGVNSNTVNINQLDPKFLSLGSALQDQVPNPFFGNPAFGSFADNKTIARGQLLRPYPQFGNILGHQVSDGKARYNAFVAKLEKRFSHGWSARVNYTYSSNKDNLTGASNFFSNNDRPRALDVYNLDAEYGPSILETPHRLNVTGTVELPFGEGKRWANNSGLARTLLGGWSVTVFGAYQSGFPVAIIQQNANTGLFNNGQQRPNRASGDPGTSGSTEDRLNNWFNPAAWTQAAPFTLGNQPRTDGRVRTPFKKNTDVSFLKSTRISGSRMLQLRLEIINAFNNPNFLGPNVIFGSSNFGRITAVRGFPRMVQLMVRFTF